MRAEDDQSLSLSDEESEKGEQQIKYRSIQVMEEIMVAPPGYFSQQAQEGGDRGSCFGNQEKLTPARDSKEEAVSGHVRCCDEEPCGSIGSGESAA